MGETLITASMFRGGNPLFSRAATVPAREILFATEVGVTITMADFLEKTKQVPYHYSHLEIGSPLPLFGCTVIEDLFGMLFVGCRLCTGAQIEACDLLMTWLTEKASSHSC